MVEKIDSDKKLNQTGEILLTTKLNEEEYIKKYQNIQRDFRELNKLNYNNIESYKEIEKVCNDIDNFLSKSKITLRFLANICAGKTTIINSIISTYSTEKFKYDNLLISENKENTYFTFEIESSETENIILIKGNKTTICKDVKELKDILKQINIEGKNLNTSNKIIKDKKKEKELNDEEKILQGKLENEKTVVIKLPNFNSKLRIIDTPGQSMNQYSDRFISELNDELCITIFILIINLTDIQSPSKSLTEIIAELNDQDRNSKFYILFNKVDDLNTKLNSNDEHENEENFSEETLSDFRNLKTIFSETTKIEYINVSPIDKKTNKDNILKVMKEIQNFCDLNHINLFYREICNKIRIILQERNCNSNEEKLISEKTILALKIKVLELKISIKEEYNKLSSNIFKIDNADKFKEKYEIQYELMKSEFNKYTEKLKKETNVVRQNFIEKQVNKLYSTYCLTYKDQIELIFTKEIQKLEDQLNEKEKKGFKDYFKNVLGLDVSTDSLLTIFSSIVTGVSIIGGHALRTAVLEGFIVYGSEILGSAAVPVIGWAIGAIALTVSLKNVIGIWSYDGTFEDIMNNIIKNFNKDLPKRIIDITDKFSKVCDLTLENISKIKKVDSNNFDLKCNETLNKYSDFGKNYKFTPVYDLLKKELSNPENYSNETKEIIEFFKKI